jgi:hypothetical protein
MITLMLHDLKGLLVLFSFSSERSGLLFAILHRMQNQNNPRKIRVLHAAKEYLPAACKRVTNALEAIAKSNQMTNRYPLEQIACRIRELHAMPIILTLYRWEKFKRFENGD